ncbi:MAG: hypothetical protein A3H28_02260 [Acidobacteria bacterium RIFCSPLOWO2_02_FULL_61_28]|nr:MAG: hypothetical protein A3H28_02260 [Acidobacteria bacterium RIFCSPLOWO2_02_FULL_61_28]
MGLRRCFPSRMIQVVFLFALFIGEWQAWAQLPTATILGVVRDPSGAVVPGVDLTARNVETGQTRRTLTGADGSYRLAALPVGNYEVQAQQAGFQTDVRRGLTLTVGQEAVVNFSLQVGAVEQTIAVTAEAPLVNTTSGSLGGLVDEQKVAELPLNGRNFIDLTLLQTGITRHENRGSTATMSGTWFSSNGAPLRSNNYMLDGAVMGNLYGAAVTSVANTTLGLEGIREYRVVTNSFSAEYGMTMGSQMTIVSKNGTNAFHGSLFEYLRNSALDARNFFDWKSAGSQRRLPAFTRNNFGGAFGGPIKKDQTFFHVVYETLRERLGITTITNVIAPSAKVNAQINPVVRPWLALFPDPNLPNNQYTFPFSQPTDEHFGQLRVDQTISGSDSLFARYTVDNTSRTKPRAYPQFRDPLASRTQSATLSESRVVTPTLLNTFRFSFSRSAFSSDSLSGISGPQFSLVPGKEIGGVSVSGVTGFGPDGASPTFTNQNVFTWSDDLFYSRGMHSLKFGTLVNRYQQYIESGLTAKGSINFPSVAAFLQGQYTTYSSITPGSVQIRSYRNSTVGFYVQDDLRPLPNFTLNLGLRYEFMTVPVEVFDRNTALRNPQLDANTTLGPVFENPSLKNFSPRLGLAWDVLGDGTTAVRGGFGLLYDIGNLGSSLLQGALAAPPFSSRSNIQVPVGQPLPFPLSVPLFFPANVLGREIRVTDYHLQQPHILQYNLTVERQLPYDMGLTLAYGGSRGINLMQVKEGNPTVPQVLAGGRLFWPGATDPEGRPLVPPAPLAPRTNPAWENITWLTAGGNSWYNSLQVGLTKRMSKGLQFQSSYTWAKTLDETQGQLPADQGGTPVTSTHRELDRGPADFDIAHNWRFNTIYRLPGLASSNGVAGKLLNGWWMSGILSLRTGFSFSPTVSSDRARKRGGANRPDRVAGRSNDDIILGGPVRYFDPLAFSNQPPGFLGNAGRGILRGPGLANLDFSLAKDTALGFLGESGKLEFRAEFFNILNRVNFAMPSAAVYAGAAAPNVVEQPLATAGRITSTAGAARQIQLALKIVF